jgi:ribosomal-protein-alanine N-acetyltransferase
MSALPKTHFRPMLAQDIPTIMPIELAAYPHPWTEKIMRDCLRTSHYHGWVLESSEDKEIIGYLFLSVVVGEAHILNLCVNPKWQGQGWGRQLLHCSFKLAARDYDANMCFLEVRPSNQPALALYESEGFNEIGMRRGYYPADKGREDAIVMAKSIIL